MFTLLELIVVIVILGILALLAIPTFHSVVRKSEIAVLTQNAQAVYQDSQAIAEMDQTTAAVSGATGDNAQLTAFDGPVSSAQLTSAVAVSEFLAPAASESMIKTAIAGSAGSQQPAGTSTPVIWAQNGTATTPGTIESYSSAWNLCVALSVPAGSGQPSAKQCSTDPGSLKLMAITTTSGETTGAVAPFVSGATSWTFSGGSSGSSTSASPVIAFTPTTSTSAVPAQVTVTSSSAGPVTVTSSGSTSGTGSSTVSVSATSTQVKLSWTISGVSPTGAFDIFRCAISGCTPDLSPAIGTASSSATSYTDSTVSAGTTFRYQLSVPDSSGATLVSNVVSVTVPSSGTVTGTSGTSGATTTTVPATTTTTTTSAAATAAHSVLEQAVNDQQTYLSKQGDNLSYGAYRDMIIAGFSDLTWEGYGVVPNTSPPEVLVVDVSSDANNLPMVMLGTEGSDDNYYWVEDDFGTSVFTDTGTSSSAPAPVTVTTAQTAVAAGLNAAQPNLAQAAGDQQSYLTDYGAGKTYGSASDMTNTYPDLAWSASVPTATTSTESSGQTLPLVGVTPTSDSSGLPNVVLVQAGAYTDFYWTQDDNGTLSYAITSSPSEPALTSTTWQSTWSAAESAAS